MEHGVTEGHEPDGERAETMLMGSRDRSDEKPPMGLAEEDIRITPEFRLDEETGDWEAVFVCHYPADKKRIGEGFAKAALCVSAIRQVLTSKTISLDILVLPDGASEDED